MNKKLNNKGFSLVELIIVVAILAILTAIIAPNFIKYMKKAQKARDAETARVMGTTLERILAIEPEAANEWFAVGKVRSHVEYTVPNPDGSSYEFSNVFEYTMTKKGDIVPDPRWRGVENHYTNGVIRDARGDCTKTKELLMEELSSNYYTISYRYNDLRTFRVGKNLSTGEVEVWACVVPDSSDGQGVTNGRITYKLYPETDPEYYTNFGEPVSIPAHR